MPDAKKHKNVKKESTISFTIDSFFSCYKGKKRAFTLKQFVYLESNIEVD